eukprot:gene8719-7933_t
MPGGNGRGGGGRGGGRGGRGPGRGPRSVSQPSTPGPGNGSEVGGYGEAGGYDDHHESVSQVGIKSEYPHPAASSPPMGMGPPAVPAPQRQLACSNPDCLYTTTCPTWVTRQTLPTMRDEWNPRGGPEAVGCPEFLYCPTCLDNDQNPVPMAVASAERATGAAQNAELSRQFAESR